MVEPLEETRNELVFATEPVISSLHLSIPGSFQYSPLVELDEVEVCNPLRNGRSYECANIVWHQIQKGILQLCKGLSFLHTSARIIHTNINPESVLINSAVSGCPVMLHTNAHALDIRVTGRSEGLV